jgi:hypothetical protein
MLGDLMVSYFKSWFNYSGLEGRFICLSAALALAFGIIWLLAHQTPFFRKFGLWGVAIGSALLTVVATAFIFFPLNYYYSQWLDSTFSDSTLSSMMLLWTIPMVLVIGLVQEGAKIIPMLLWRIGEKPDIKTSMMIGAAAGAGFGLFQAFNGFAYIFASGWVWDYVTSGGVEALLPFWVQFWMIVCHIGISAIVGYGLATGRGLGFYFLAALLHAVVVYFSVLANNTTITGNQYGVILAIAAAIIMAISLWLRWRKEPDEIPIIQPAPPDQPTMV